MGDNMLFEELHNLKKPRLISLDKRNKYKLVDSNQDKIVYKNSTSGTTYKLTKAQARRTEKELRNRDITYAKHIRHHLRQSKSWVFALMQESKIVDMQTSPIRIKWSTHK